MKPLIWSRNLVRRVHTINFIIEKVKPSDRREVWRLMREIFYKNDPSSVYSKVSEKSAVSSTLKEMTMEPLREDLSFTVKKNRRDTKLVGVLINGSRPVDLDPSYLDKQIRETTCKKEKTLLQLWKFVALKPSDAKSLFGNEKDLLELRYMAVEKDFTKRGIASALVKTGRKEAIARGFKYIRLDCTSTFSSRIASSMGMKSIFSMNYTDFRTPDGEQPFREVTPPHVNLQVFVDKLS